MKRGGLVAVLLSILLITLALPFMVEDVEANPSEWNDDFVDESKIYTKGNAKATGGNMIISQLATDYSWKKEGMVLEPGPPEEPFIISIAHPAVLKGHDGIYRMWYSGTSDSSRYYSYYATSLDGVSWTKHGFIPFPKLSGTWYDRYVHGYSAFYEDGQYKIWYTGRNLGTEYTIHQAVSPDGMTLSYGGMAIPQGGGDWSAAYPSVINDTGIHKMWYSRLVSGIYWATAYATSPDGIDWTKHGLVMGRDPLGPDDKHLANSVVVKNSTGNYRMWYGGIGTTWRVLYAESPDDIDWTDRRGIVLYEGVPGALDESMVVPGSVRLPLPHAGWMWYTGWDAGGTGRVFLATMGSVGSFMSTEIMKDDGTTWDELIFRKTIIPGETEILVSVIDADTMEPIPGLVDVTGDVIDLSSIADSVRTIRLRAELFGTVTDTPFLHDWRVTWVDSLEPDFDGLKSVADVGSGGVVYLSWDLATDATPPITYNVYVSQSSLSQNFGTPDYTTQASSLKITGLQNGIEYYFVVRAQDSLGQEDNNTVEKSVIPTTYVDEAPPEFTGVQSADDLGMGGNITLSWNEAIDPDSPESNSDPSIPVSYNIYISSVSGGQDFSNPNQTTTDTQATLSGLQIGVRYYFVVRAMDAAGNEETNSVEISAMPTSAIDTTPPHFDGVQIVLTNDDKGKIALSWNKATDPDNPGCPNDPSTPVRYNIYVSDTPTDFDFSQPIGFTELQHFDVFHLDRGVTYYFIVRAEDAAGNEESNLIAVHASLETEEGQFNIIEQSWILVLLAIIVAIIVAIVFLKRRRKGPFADVRNEEDTAKEFPNKSD